MLIKNNLHIDYRYKNDEVFDMYGNNNLVWTLHFIPIHFAKNKEYTENLRFYQWYTHIRIRYYAD